MATTGTLKQRAQSEVLYNPSNGYITPLGIEFPDGSIVTTARKVSIGKVTFPSGLTSSMGTSGVGNFGPPPQTFDTPISGPNVLVEYQVKVGGSPTTEITDGETPTLYVNGTAVYSDGSTEALNAKVQPVTSVLATSVPSYVSLSQPLYFANKQLVGFQMQFKLYGPSTSSDNILTMGQCVVDVYYGTAAS